MSGSMFEEPDFSRASSDDVDRTEPPADLEADDLDYDGEDWPGAGGADEEEGHASGEAMAGVVADEGNEATNQAQGTAARAVLEHVTRALVDDPDSVVVDMREGRSGLRFSVHVAQGDMGRIIGRKGRTAQAIRTIVRAAAASDGTEASVDIAD
jgi:uncharacterized protein